MNGKITWARPLIVAVICLTVMGLHAASLPVPYWADVCAPLMLATWFIDRSLWKFVTRNKQ